MFKKFSAGQSVPRGVYWHGRAWDLVIVSEDGDRLPAGEDATYYSLPVLLVVALGPLAGLVFILTLPLLVPALFVYGAGRGLAGRMRGGAASGRGREVPTTP